MEKKHCVTCRFAKELTYGPSPSGPKDGVLCMNKEVAEEQDTLEEYEQEGHSHLFTVEALDGDEASCSYWKIKLPESKRIFRLKMKEDRGIQDGIVFAVDMEAVEEMKRSPVPHYVGFSWDDVEEIVEITQEQLDTLLESEKAGVADL